jgi:hypothetical protein
VRRFPLCAILLCLLFVRPAFLSAQTSGSANQTLGINQFPGSARSLPIPGIQDSPTMGPRDASQVQKRLNMMNTERQKELVDDTNKLLALARELDGEIAASNTGDLTPEQIRKVAEIEKLAHSVRDKMSESVHYEPPGLDMGPIFLPYQ